MTNTMLVDATQPEETRVAVVNDDTNLLQDFDFESNIIKQIKGNIYLAKVTRVEPSLQSAFLEYGGNRQAFLPFTEIHPDYFRIPVADRQKLIEQEQVEGDDFEDDDIDLEDGDEAAETTQEVSSKDSKKSENDDVPTVDDIRKAKSEEPEDEVDEEIEENKPVFRISHKNYKIQEVVKPRQIMLIQITKEERGSKGAAVTTFISLPGRYCVLMPNSNHGGGVSRKINNPNDRKKMKKILAGLNIPEGMSVILRTAGIGKTKTEIKRDLDYLLRLWNNIRELTLKSNAPALVYEEGNLVKRSIRDRFAKDIDNVLISGKEGYKEARAFMKMLSPSKSSKIKEYKDAMKPIFQAHSVERQIEEIYSPVAYMPSGGSIVINPTEALVSIDVNSGRSTKERHIEETALQTNLEAAAEVARQLRLRDLGGLVVIDFIDMENYKNNRLVEKKLKECLSKDRARVQVGRISNFGLLELSRQRLRPSLFETNYKPCPHCLGTGRVRTVESAALNVLRAVEREAIASKGKKEYIVKAHPDTAMYVLNQKRYILNEIEVNHNVSVMLEGDTSFTSGQYQILYKGNVVATDTTQEEHESLPVSQQTKKSSHSRNSKNNDDDNNGKKKRRRGKRGGRRRSKSDDQNDDNSNQNEDNKQNDTSNNDDHSNNSSDDNGKNKKRRRNNRNNKNNRSHSDKGDDDTKNENSNDQKSDNKSDNADNNKASDNKKPQKKKENSGASDESVKSDDQKDKKETKKPSRSRRSKSSKEDKSSKDETLKETKSETQSKDKSSKADDKKNVNDNADKKESVASEKKKKTAKKGWWQRLKDGA